MLSSGCYGPHYSTNDLRAHSGDAAVGKLLETCAVLMLWHVLAHATATDEQYVSAKIVRRVRALMVQKLVFLMRMHDACKI